MMYEELEQCAISLNEINAKFNKLMSYYERRCADLLEKLKHIDFSESDAVFNELFAIQDVFAKLKYKYHINMNQFFEDFIYYFDRQDDVNKEFLYHHFHIHSGYPK